MLSRYIDIADFVCFETKLVVEAGGSDKGIGEIWTRFPPAQ